MMGSGRAWWLWVACAAPLIVVGLLAMHGLTGAQPIAERSSAAAHELTHAHGHRMPPKGAHDHVHDVALCVWVLVAAFALVALRRQEARLSEHICAAVQSIATRGRALMRAPPVSARLSMVGMSLR